MYVFSGTASSFVGYGPFGYVAIATCAVVAAIVTILRSNQHFLKENNEELRAGREDDEHEIKKWKEKYTESETEKSKALGENKILRELNSAQPNFSELTAAIGGLKTVMDAILEVLLERKEHEQS